MMRNPIKFLIKSAWEQTLSKNKSFSTGISQRYALALYELSKEENKIEEFVSSLNLFMKIYNSNEDLKNFVKNPTHSVGGQKSI